MTKKGLQCYWYKAYKRSLPLIVSSVVKRNNLGTGTKMTIIGIRPFKRFVVQISKQFINKRIIEIVCPMIVVGLGKFIWIHQHYYSCPLNCNLLLFPEIFNSFNNIRKLTSFFCVFCFIPFHRLFRSRPLKAPCIPNPRQ